MVDEQRYPFFGVPPARKPRPAASEPSLTGKRVILSTEEGFVYDMRAAGELYTDGSGEIFVDIVTEPSWFGREGAVGATVSWPAHLVWVE